MHTPSHGAVALIGFLMLFACIVPTETSARTHTCADIGTITIAANTLVQTATKPTITGNAEGIERVQLRLYKAGSTKTLYTSRVVVVRDGTWKVKVAKKLSAGMYTVDVFCKKATARTLLLTETLTIGSVKSAQGNSTLAVALVPLLTGGTVHPGGSVPVSYLQVTNMEKKATTLKGFWVTERGSAPESAVIGFSIVDDTGGSRVVTGGTEGQTPFKNGKAFVEAGVLFAPGEMRLFTIKAVLSATDSSIIGKQLMIDVASVDASATIRGSFPIRGTTWTIVP